uniref:Uncharacterized protein n=1 Tax=Oryza meridionalis TaxID=40149 RepID=A0A0E0D2W0_9ORYZ
MATAVRADCWPAPVLAHRRPQPWCTTRRGVADGERRGRRRRGVLLGLVVSRAPPLPPLALMLSEYYCWMVEKLIEKLARNGRNAVAINEHIFSTVDGIIGTFALGETYARRRSSRTSSST